MTPRGRGSAGFTLVELVVVLVLLGAMLAVVTPAFIASTDVSTPEAQLVSALESARATAIRTGASVDVVFDPRSARVWVTSARREARLDTSFLVGTAGTAYLATQRRSHFRFRGDGAGWGDTIVVTSQGSATRVFIKSPAGSIERRRSTTAVIAP